MPNESAKIILAVTHAKLSKVRDALAVEGTINALQVGFQFRTPDWDNTTKTVVFVRGRATPSTTNADTTYRILNENNECDVPPEMLAQNGMFSVGVFGVRDNYRIVSNWMCYRITDGCYADGSTPIDPSSTIYEQIISMINNKSSIGHNHDERYYTKDESNDKFLTEEDLPRIPVTSVNQKIGDVVLSAEDVGAFANTVDEQGNQVQTIPYAAIKDRPFYEDALIDITWDGDTTGKTSVSDVFYLVSSDTPSVEDLIGCTSTVHTDSGEEHSEVITETMISQPADNVIDLADTLFVALEDGAVYGTSVFPTKGTYFLKYGNTYIVSLFKGTLKKLDPKFIDMDSLPKEVLKITVTYDSSTDTYSADKTSDDIKTCLDNGGIPYVYFTSGYNEYTLTGYSADLRCYCFSNIHSTMREIDIHDSGDVTVVADSKFFNNLEYIDNKVTAIDNTATNRQYPSALAVKTELDKTIKITEQTLTDEQKTQARTNIGAGGPQVQSDYTQNDNTQADYIKNRPFYEYTTMDITWDGDTAGKTEVDLTSALGFNVYLVSDATPSVEDLTGSTLTIYDGSSSMELSVSALALSENVIIGSDGYVFVILADNSEFNGITFPSKGTYLVSGGGSYVSRITKKVINKIDPKFIDMDSLPKEVLKITVTYDSSTDTLSADKTSDDIKTCLDNGGIPYVDYARTIYTYDGSGDLGRAFRSSIGSYIFISGASVTESYESLYENTSGKVTAISDSVTDDQYPSALSVKTELDKTVKITEQTLTDEQKSQARTNIGAGVPQVQSDYTQNDSTKPDYVKNRPCYEDVSINITWDGDTTDRIAASDSDYLVSYDTPSSEDLIGASYTSYNYGERTFVLTADSITYPVENLICVSGVVFIALDNNVTYEEKTFPAKGTYFHKTSLYRSISLYKGTLKKLDPKFIDTDSLPKELLKVTVLYDASTGYSADKTYLDISNCLENGGIPYIALYKGVSTSGMYEIITYCGLSGQGYVFINADSGNVLIVKNNNIVLLVSSNLKLELDKTVKTESQTLSESQKDQARANIGAAETAFGITGASVGQIIKIKAIDDSGVPTGWEVCNSETWTFTLDDGSTVTKEVYVR